MPACSNSWLTVRSATRRCHRARRPSKSEAANSFLLITMPANIVVPEMGESIVDARIAKWLKREGDPVAAGEALVELETDKIDVEVSAPQGGVLGQITRPVGEDVKIGEVIGVIADSGHAAEQAETPRRASPQTPAPPASSPSAPPP